MWWLYRELPSTVHGSQDWPRYGEGSFDFVPLLLPELLLNPDGSW